MRSPPVPLRADSTTRAAEATVFPILVAISLSHLLNDSLQSLIPAIYPLVKESFRLSFAQIGLITFTFQLTASLLQPVVGALTDRRPQPFSLATGMGFTLCGLVLLSFARTYPALLVSVGLVGLGNADHDLLGVGRNDFELPLRMRLDPSAANEELVGMAECGHI